MELGTIADEGPEVDRFLPGHTKELPRRLIRCLNDSGVRYSIQHEPDLKGLAGDSVNLGGLVQTAVVRAGKQRLLAVLPDGWSVDLKKFGTLVGGQARLETEDEFKWLFPDCALGAVLPFGNLYGLPTWLDSSLTKAVEISFLAGTLSDVVNVNYAAFAEIVRPSIGKFGAKNGPSKRALKAR